jgi:WD40 repeat protein
MINPRDHRRGAKLSALASLALLFPAPLAAQPMISLKGHTREVLTVWFSPDGKRIASASYDRMVKVWDVQALQRPKKP